MAKTPAYTITTADDTKVAERTEGKAADKLAEKLTAETGLAHRVYTPTGKLRLETEVIEPAPADEIPVVDINDVIEEVVAEAAEKAPIEVREMTVGDDIEDGDEEIEDDDEDETPVKAPVKAVNPAIVVREMTVGDDIEDGEEEAATDVKGFVSYATLQDLLKNDDDAVRADAAHEWAFRLEVYKKRTNAKDASQRIVGPAMAAALERGATTDGRTVASLAKRGLVVRGDGLEFTVNAAGKAALAAAIAAVAPTV